MGIIIKQSLRGSIWSYLGLVVGYVNVGIIMPNFFRPDQIGLVQLFVALSAIFSNFSSLGFASVINRLFPEFRDSKGNHNGFPFLILLTACLGFALSAVSFLFIRESIVSANVDKSPLLVEYIFLLLPLIFFRIFYHLFNAYNVVLYDAVTGTFWNDFVHKLINLVLVTLFSFKIIDFNLFFYGYILSLSLPAFPLLFVLYKRGELNLKPDLDFLNKPLVREIAIVAGFGMLNGLSGVVTTNVDKLLINRFLSLEYVGIFSVCALFAMVINIPSRATAKISTGILAQSWKSNDLKKIHSIYRKASINQSVIGLLIYSGIIVNLDNIFQILPEAYEAGKWVIVIYALGVLIRVSTTTSGMILITSRYYKFNSLIVFSQILISVIFQFTFIPIFGITGAAVAVLMTFLVRTIIIVTFIKIKMNMFCYTPKHLVAIIIAVTAALAVYFLPDSNLLVVNILYKSSLVTLLFSSAILYFNVSIEINQIYQSLKRKIFTLI